jgi:hypothetical protein
MTNENETNTELRAMPSVERAHTELATNEQVGTTKGSAVQDEAARMNRPAENANRHESSVFFSPAQAQAYRSRWNDIQVSFVDDPAGSVEQANVLVRDAIEHLTEGFSTQRQKLDERPDRSNLDTTEERRLLLCRYRSLVERLVSI